MSNEEGVRAALVKYGRLFDLKRWDDLAMLFAEDATIVSRRGTFSGRAAVIRDLQNAMTPEYHGILFASNVHITMDGDTATAISDFLEIEDRAIIAVGTYTDTLVKPGDAWVFSRKEIRLK